MKKLLSVLSFKKPNSKRELGAPVFEISKSPTKRPAKQQAPPANNQESKIEKKSDEVAPTVASPLKLGEQQHLLQTYAVEPVDDPFSPAGPPQTNKPVQSPSKSSPSISFSQSTIDLSSALSIDGKTRLRGVASSPNRRSGDNDRGKDAVLLLLLLLLEKDHFSLFVLLVVL